MINKLIKVINKIDLDYVTDKNLLTDSRVNQYRDISISATETEDTLTIKAHFTPSASYMSEYDIEKTFYKSEFKDTVTDLTLIKKKIENPYELMVLTRKYNRVVAPLVAPVNGRLLPYATVFITDDTVWIIPRVRLTINSNKFDNCEYSEEDFGDKTTQQVLFDHCPEAKAVADKWYIKKEALSDSIDVNSSISYLENQVDVLYKILDQLIEKTGIDVEEYKDIMNEVNVNSSLTVNSLEKVASKISKNKKQIRDRQKAYYRMLREAGFDA